MSEPQYDPDDILDGAPAIARFLHWTPRQVYYAAERRTIPLGKRGLKLQGSKRKLSAHFASDQITGGEPVR